jgi:hypothetical protein
MADRRDVVAARIFGPLQLTLAGRRAGGIAPVLAAVRAFLASLVQTGALARNT